MTPERRFYEGTVKNEVEEGVIYGYGAVFNSSSQRLWDRNIGEFTEEIDPTAFQSSLSDPDILILSNHNQDLVLGRVGAGTAEVGIDERGAWYKVRPPETRKDVLESVKRGDISGSSFAFDIGEEEWEERDGVPHRTIRSFQKIYDLGPVSYPAYPDTSATARSYMAFKEQQEENRKNEAADSLSRYKLKLWIHKNSITI